MRARFHAFLPLLLVLTFFGIVRPTHAGPNDVYVPCYCRYGATSPDFQSPNAGTDAPKYCPNEVYWLGKVPAPNSVVANVNCRVACTNAGSQFVGITTVPPDQWQPEAASPSENLVAHEYAYCAFSSLKGFDNPADRPFWWGPVFAGCNDAITKKHPTVDPNVWPESCSFCFCKYKDGQGTNGACAGKTTLLKPTSYPEKCESLCTTMGLDPMGTGADGPNDHCVFTFQNGCTAPLNPNVDACKRELAAAQASASSAASAAAFQAGKGSPLALLLPFGDISLPELIARIIRQVMGVVGAIAFVYFIWGGIQYMTAAGDDKKIGTAKATIIAATSGLVAIFLSYAVLTLIINAIK